MFFKLKQKLWENVPKEAVFKRPAAKLYKCLFLSYVLYIMLLNLVLKSKCEKNLILLCTKFHIYLPQWRSFGAFLRACP